MHLLQEGNSVHVYLCLLLLLQNGVFEKAMSEMKKNYKQLEEEVLTEYSLT